jgi:tRNA nucleotidyltransferase/poly(A) polymerase|tara:strand:- start:751 stop:1959 length:1209 start_codon:yes stop_codon:yes gene_type:complete
MNIKKETEVEKIFKAISSFSPNSEIRYVGGCVRKIINKEKVDDIDLAVNLNPANVCEALKKENIKYYESGIQHGTITALINNIKFEITSLRKDIETDGRHAKIEFSNNWKEDASRRDFTINSIYADLEGNLFDPFDGKKDLKIGKINFIGNAEIRIKEDYLRVLRYIRFFLNYSKNKHNPETIRTIKKNLSGFSNISSERLLDEFQKLLRSEGFFKLMKDKDCLEIINLIFPQLKNISIFNKLNNFAKDHFNEVDFIFLLSLIIIDGTDNVDYFIYKFNLSKKDQKRLLFLNNFNTQKIHTKTYSEKNLNKIFYFNGREALMDIIYFKIFKSKKIDNNLLKMIENFKDKEIPTMPLKADILMGKYNISEGKELGKKLKAIEEVWTNNDFKITEKEVQDIVNG